MRMRWPPEGRFLWSKLISWPILPFTSNFAAGKGIGPSNLTLMDGLFLARGLFQLTQQRSEGGPFQQLLKILSNGRPSAVEGTRISGRTAAYSESAPVNV
jgi:hypothetical protein